MKDLTQLENLPLSCSVNSSGFSLSWKTTGGQFSQVPGAMTGQFKCLAMLPVPETCVLLAIKAVPMRPGC